jgi:hypothetical protein
MKYGVKCPIAVVFLLIPCVLILAACGSNGSFSSSKPGQTTPTGSQTVHILLSDTGADSSLTTFTAGMPYHSVVTNSRQVAQQFFLIPKGMGMEQISPDEMLGRTL